MTLADIFVDVQGVNTMGNASLYMISLMFSIIVSSLHPIPVIPLNKQIF